MQNRQFSNGTHLKTRIRSPISNNVWHVLVNIVLKETNVKINYNFSVYISIGILDKVLYQDCNMSKINCLKEYTLVGNIASK